MILFYFFGFSQLNGTRMETNFFILNLNFSIVVVSIIIILVANLFSVTTDLLLIPPYLYPPIKVNPPLIMI